MKKTKRSNIYLFTFTLIYIFSPAPLKLLLLMNLLYVMFKRPELASIILIISPIFDQKLIIPYLDRSILLIVIPIAILSILVNYKQRKELLKTLPILLIFSVLLIFATIKGYYTVTEIEGFSDPSRGFVFLISIVYISLILFSNNVNNFISNIRNNLVVVTLLFLVSIPISYLIYPDHIEQLRFQGTFGDPNYFSRYAIIALFIGFSMIKNKSIRLIIISVIFLFIILSVSRTAFIILVLSSILYVVKKNPRFKIIYLISFSLLFFALIIPIISGSSFLRLDTTDIWFYGIRLYEPIDVISSGRTYLLRYFFREISIDNPLMYFGGGIGYSSSFFTPLLGESMVSHNSFLDVILDFGIVGLFILCLLLYRLIKITSSSGVSIDSIYPYVMLSFLVYSSALSGFWVKQNIAILLLIIISYGKKIYHK